MKKAGVMLEDGFAPGFICYGIPVGCPRYVSHMLKERAEEIVKEKIRLIVETRQQSELVKGEEELIKCLKEYTANNVMII